MKKLKEHTAFVCRTNAPLAMAAIDLLKNGMDFEIIGRDFSKELIGMVERVTGKGWRARKIAINQLGSALNGYVADLEDKWRGKIAKADELNEIRQISDAVAGVLKYLGDNAYTDPYMRRQIADSSQFVDYLKARFGGVDIDRPEAAAALAKRDPHSYVTLTSAHRSKGLEFGRVFILGNELFPHPKARTAEELGQEANAQYVAYTRAMNELHVLAPLEKPEREGAEDRA